MNKNVVNQELNAAYEALNKAGIARNGEIKKTYRGQISTFGAAVTMGSLPAAIAFFSDEGGASVDRTKLIRAIELVLEKNNLFEYVISVELNSNEARAIKEEVMNACIALKLAMNLYKLTD